MLLVDVFRVDVLVGVSCGGMFPTKLLEVSGIVSKIALV